jgi:hypothetical protein
MKARLGTLVSYGAYMSGTLGEAVIVLERDGKTRDGKDRWRLMLAHPNKPKDEAQHKAHNRRGASWRMERRKAEGVEILGGE